MILAENVRKRSALAENYDKEGKRGDLFRSVIKSDGFQLGSLNRGSCTESLPPFQLAEKRKESYLLDPSISNSREGKTTNTSRQVWFAVFYHEIPTIIVLMNQPVWTINFLLLSVRRGRYLAENHLQFRIMHRNGKILVFLDFRSRRSLFSM